MQPSDAKVDILPRWQFPTMACCALLPFKRDRHDEIHHGFVYAKVGLSRNLTNPRRQLRIKRYGDALEQKRQRYERRFGEIKAEAD